VGDHDDVAVLELGRGRDQPGEVVSLADLRQAGDPDDPELAQGRPVRRTPA
jgi:hypothetical protein